MLFLDIGAPPAFHLLCVRPVIRTLPTTAIEAIRRQKLCSESLLPLALTGVAVALDNRGDSGSSDGTSPVEGTGRRSLTAQLVK